MASFNFGSTSVGQGGIIQVTGLKELEAGLKKLREQLGVKTGGIIYRGLSAGAMIVVKDAKRRAPKRDPSGFIQARIERQQAEQSGKKLRGRRLKGELGRGLAMIRSNIIQRKIPSGAPLAGGKPTVLIGVRNAGFDRVTNRRGKSIIRFRKPGSSPGYWWWVELGTSRMPARPFLRPALNSQAAAASEKMRDHIAQEIQRHWAGKYKR